MVDIISNQTDAEVTEYFSLENQLNDFIKNSGKPLSWSDIDPIVGEIIEKYPNSFIAFLKENMENCTVEYNKEDGTIVYTLKPTATDENLG